MRVVPPAKSKTSRKKKSGKKSRIVNFKKRQRARQNGSGRGLVLVGGDVQMVRGCKS